MRQHGLALFVRPYNAAVRPTTLPPFLSFLSPSPAHPLQHCPLVLLPLSLSLYSLFVPLSVNLSVDPLFLFSSLFFHPPLFYSHSVHLPWNNSTPQNLPLSNAQILPRAHRIYTLAALYIPRVIFSRWLASRVPRPNNVQQGCAHINSHATRHASPLSPNLSTRPHTHTHTLSRYIN